MNPEFRIIYAKPDGGIAIVIPAPGVPRKAALRAVPEGAAYRFVEPDAIPADRSFRDAWALEGESVAIDMPRARDIHRDRIRAARAPLLASLDTEALRAQEAPTAAARNAAIARIAERKQVLRDAPADPAIEAAKTVDDLPPLPVAT